MKNKKNNGFILFSRFDNIVMQDPETDKVLATVDFKINDEAIRYDRIKKVFICGSGERVFVDTYDNMQYIIETSDLNESRSTLLKLVKFAESDEPFLNFTHTGLTRDEAMQKAAVISNHEKN